MTEQIFIKCPICKFLTPEQFINTLNDITGDYKYVSCNWCGTIFGVKREVVYESSTCKTNSQGDDYM